jgi:hypothetical protein
MNQKEEKLFQFTQRIIREYHETIMSLHEEIFRLRRKLIDAGIEIE